MARMCDKGGQGYHVFHISGYECLCKRYRVHLESTYVWTDEDRRREREGQRLARAMRDEFTNRLEA